MQVTTVSDITTGDGRAILSSALHSQVNPFQTTRYLWPQQGPPTPADWKLWEAAITHAILSPRPHQPRALEFLLGHWLDSTTPWQSYFSPNEQRIYIKERTVWRTWSTRPRRCRGNGRSSFCQGGGRASSPVRRGSDTGLPDIINLPCHPAHRRYDCGSSMADTGPHSPRGPTQRYQLPVGG